MALASSQIFINTSNIEALAFKAIIERDEAEFDTKVKASLAILQVAPVSGGGRHRTKSKPRTKSKTRR